MIKPKYKGFYNIVKNEAKKEATIYIYGVIGGFNWDSFSYENTADKFIADFKQVEATADIIHVKINSPGGNVHDGLPIFNALNNSEKTIYTYVDGIAYSMAALIALSGDKVHGYKNSLFMVHNASTIVWGNAKELEAEMDVLKKYDDALGTIIEDKLNISDSAVQEKYLNYTDNFFTAKEAKKEGFFDELINSKKSSVPDNIKNMSSKDLMEHYMKLNIDMSDEDYNSSKSNNSNNTTMSTERKNLQSVLGIEAPLASTENGSYLNDEQLNTIETAFSNHTNALQQANDAKTTAEQTVNDLTTGNTAIVDGVNKSLGLEGDAKVTNVTDAVAALNTQIASLGEQPGEMHTKIKTDKEGDENPHAYMDFNTPFYKKANQLLK